MSICALRNARKGPGAAAAARRGVAISSRCAPPPPLQRLTAKQPRIGCQNVLPLRLVWQRAAARGARSVMLTWRVMHDITTHGAELTPQRCTHATTARQR
jgi:hypothetical protein